MPLNVPSMRSKHSQAMQAFFNAYGKEVFTMSHWDLAKVSEFTADEWREFLTDPAVTKYIRDEMNALSEVESRKIIMDISKNSRSTGTAQTLMALDKSRGGSDKKDGPVFIYMYVPLNEREAHADNVKELDTDPFRVKKE